MQLKGPGVFMPQKVDILVSEDGENYAKKARYVRYHAYRSTMRGFLFLDEVVVN